MTRHLPFEEVLADETGGNIKTLRSDYLADGRIAVVDQGKALVSGYINDEERVCKSELPAIIFGDHTRCFKFIDFPFALGADGVKVLRPKLAADVKYLFYYLQNLDIPNAGYDRHFKYLKRTKILLPPLDEQKRIAEVLDKADALRQKRRVALQKLDSLLQSVFFDMFGDPVSNPKELATTLLRDICTRITDGTHQPPQFTNHGLPFLFVSNIGKGSMTLQTSKFISEATQAELTRRCPIDLGDILYTTVGSYGNAAVVKTDEKFAFQRHIAHLKPNNSIVNSDFLVSMLLSSGVRRQVDQKVKGIAQKTLNLAELNTIKVLLPPRSQQDKFASLTEQIWNFRAKLTTFETHGNQLFHSLQKRAFDGELFSDTTQAVI